MIVNNLPEKHMMEVQCPDNHHHEDLGLGNGRNDLLLGRLPTKKYLNIHCKDVYMEAQIC